MIFLSTNNNLFGSRSWLTWNNCIYLFWCIIFKTFETPILNENRALTGPLCYRDLREKPTLPANITPNFLGHSPNRLSFFLSFEKTSPASDQVPWCRSSRWLKPFSSAQVVQTIGQVSVFFLLFSFSAFFLSYSRSFRVTIRNLSAVVSKLEIYHLVFQICQKIQLVLAKHISKLSHF